MMKQDFSFLKDLVSYQSIYNTEEAAAAAEFIAGYLEQKAGMSVRVHKIRGNSFILGEYAFSREAEPGILFYGHYDVKPVKTPLLWETEPYRLTRVGEKFHGRGAADDKGQLFCFIKALEELKSSPAACRGTVRFLLDGGEESGSHGLEELKRENPGFFKNELYILCDGAQPRDDEFILGLGTRGQLDVQIEIARNQPPLHPGKVMDNKEDLILKLSRLVREIAEVYQRSRAAQTVVSDGEPPESDPATFPPSLSFTYINSGLQSRSLVPSSGAVHFDLRYLEDFDDRGFLAELESAAEGIDKDFTINVKQNYAPLVQNRCGFIPDRDFLDKIRGIISREVIVYSNLGFSLPLANLVRDEKFLILPLASPGSNNHTANENIQIEYLEKGISLCRFLISNRLSHKNQ